MHLNFQAEVVSFDVATTLGALLVGGLVAAMFSGVVTVQTFAYFKYYPLDLAGIKMLVLSVWFLDFCHTIFVSVSLWDHMIAHFGDVERIDFIPWSLALTIAFTAVLTFLVHCFFVHRIYKLSRKNCFIAVPLGIVACMRLGFACLTTVKMITLRSLHEFVVHYTWSFTLGLALSTLLDILITGFLCFFLMVGRKKTSNMNHILDTLMLYAFENGALTCAATVVSMICWITMPTNLIFMGLHFVISKFYANSLLATLNTRKQFNNGYNTRSISRSDGSRALPVVFPDHASPLSRTESKRYSRRGGPFFSKGRTLQINVEESVIRTVDCKPGTPDPTMLTPLEYAQPQ